MKRKKGDLPGRFVPGYLRTGQANTLACPNIKSTLILPRLSLRKRRVKENSTLLI